uniref:Uncharacterized protein n=1 Tax=Lygus hesperus TaxID=30085 RepID=A0A146KV52_LYGHE
MLPRPSTTISAAAAAMAVTGASGRQNTADISGLLVIVNELVTAHHNNATVRVTHLLPCVTTALQILIHLCNMPNNNINDDGEDDSSYNAGSVFNSLCMAIRASGGVRTLLDVMRLRMTDAPMSAKLSFFPVLARAVHVIVQLRHYGDTNTLLKNLGVYLVAQELI